MSNRNNHVEQTVHAALDVIDRITIGDSIELPSPENRKLIDGLIISKANSVKLASLFLLFYWLQDFNWNRCEIPVGIRGKYGDKLLAEELNKRNITLHGNITAFGENLGWKGNVRAFDLSNDTRFEFLFKLNNLSYDELRKTAFYLAYLFAKSQVTISPLPDIGANILTFVKAKVLLHNLISIPSEGHIQQFLIAALLSVHRARHGYEIRTHHPHASDKFDQSAGDIEEFHGSEMTRAYEVTVRDDWQNRIHNFKYKMDAYGLNKYIIIASNISLSPQWREPANMLRNLQPYGRDIAVIDILEFINVFAAELNAKELIFSINKTYDYLLNNRLCGRSDIIQKYQSCVNSWLDSEL